MEMRFLCFIFSILAFSCAVTSAAFFQLSSSESLSFDLDVL